MPTDADNPPPVFYYGTALVNVPGQDNKKIDVEVVGRDPLRENFVYCLDIEQGCLLIIDENRITKLTKTSEKLNENPSRETKTSQ